MVSIFQSLLLCKLCYYTMYAVEKTKLNTQRPPSNMRSSESIRFFSHGAVCVSCMYRCLDEHMFWRRLGLTTSASQLVCSPSHESIIFIILRSVPGILHHIKGHPPKAYKARLSPSPVLGNRGWAFQGPERLKILSLPIQKSGLGDQQGDVVRM